MLYYSPRASTDQSIVGLASKVQIVKPCNKPSVGSKDLSALFVSVYLAHAFSVSMLQQHHCGATTHVLHKLQLLSFLIIILWLYALEKRSYPAEGKWRAEPVGVSVICDFHISLQKERLGYFSGNWNHSISMIGTKRTLFGAFWSLRFVPFSFGVYKNGTIFKVIFF